ncbi:uncharacterized protein LOC143711010 [Siphateles boraxobius]|uniref:uncharacterized protein LOC143711010 n=1 Tax=Siphateles boraxobius TaxID=180520 RepID=UPI00406340FB
MKYLAIPGIYLALKNTGISGVHDDHVFISSGENVRLSCNNALSDCKSTTWIYSSFDHSYSNHSETVELIDLGIKKKDTERRERLSLESDCSLNIKNVTEEDYGLYICQQYVNGQKQGTDARVYLHVLLVSVSPSSSSSASSSSQTEISPGRSVTLSCQLYSDTGFSCDYRVSSEGVELLWVNQAGVDLKRDSRYQISSSSHQHHCITTLTTTLLNEDNNREWRCQLTHRNQLQTSVTYTVKYSGMNHLNEHSSFTAQADSTTAVNQVHITHSQSLLIVSIVEIAVFAAPTVILLQIICARRAAFNPAAAITPPSVGPRKKKRRSLRQPEPVATATRSPENLPRASLSPSPPLLTDAQLPLTSFTAVASEDEAEEQATKDCCSILASDSEEWSLHSTSSSIQESTHTRAGADAELMRLLTQAVDRLGLEWSLPKEPTPNRLDGCFLQSLK